MDPTTFSFSGMNWLGLGLALVANVVIGFAWYAKWSPTGKVWMRNMGMDPDNLTPPPGAQMAASMGLMLLGALLMMFVFAHNFWAYQDAYQLKQVGYRLSLMDGVMGALFTWLGFIVPINLNRVAFERQKWSSFWVNAGYYLVTLLVAGILLTSVGKVG